MSQNLNYFITAHEINQLIFQQTNLESPDFLGELDALGVAQPPHIPQLVRPLNLQNVAQELNARLAPVERGGAHCRVCEIGYTGLYVKLRALF